MKTATVLIVDDDRNFLQVLAYHIQEFGFRHLAASSGTDALELLRAKGIDLVMTDLRMPGMDGFRLLEEIRKLNPDIPVIVLTAHGMSDKAVEAFKRGASDFLAKPYEKEELQRAILRALRIPGLQRENRRHLQPAHWGFHTRGHK